MSEQDTPHDFWEGRWQSGETPWDHGRVAPPLEEFVEKKGPLSGNVLVPGPGSGHDVHFLASLGANVTGLDIAPSAIKVAESLNPHPNATYLLGNILDPDPGLWGTFDWVFEHTCLCALNPENWEAYAASIPRLLKPGGHYLALFYRNPHDDDGPPFGISAETIERLFSGSFERLESWVPTRAYDSRQGREELCLFKGRS